MPVLGVLHADGLQPRAAGAQGKQCLKAFLAHVLGILNVDALQPQAAGTQGTPYLKAFLADQLGLLNVDGLQTRARHAMPEGPPCRPAGTSPPPRATLRGNLFLSAIRRVPRVEHLAGDLARPADKMAMRTFDVLPNRADSTPCMSLPTAFIADQLALCTRCPKAFIADKPSRRQVLAPSKWPPA